MIWSKYKRVIWIICAILLVVLLVFIRDGKIFNFVSNLFHKPNDNSGLTYDSNTTVSDWINKDSDGDGIPDWEERLWGTDPNNPETIPGVPDAQTIQQMKEKMGADSTNTGTPVSTSGSLTKTDQFSRDFMATVSTLSENGTLDQATIDKLSSSLSDEIQNTTQQKVYTLADLKITNDNSINAVKKYSTAIDNLYPKNPVKYTVINVLNEFSPDGNNVYPEKLSELNPIIKQENDLLVGTLKAQVPQSLALLDLNFINKLETLLENLNSITMYNTDPILSLSGIGKYNQSSTDLATATQALTDAINQKLKD